MYYSHVAEPMRDAPGGAERALLERWAPALVAELAPRTLMELGAGSAEKSRIILDAMRAADESGTYVPVDVSASFLEATAARLRAEYPGMTVIPVVADYNAARGATAEFNRNVLRVLNRELGADFDPAAFAHRAFYDRELHRVE